MTVWDPDGPAPNGPRPPVLVVLGTFSAIGGVPYQRLATWDGSKWEHLPDHPSLFEPHSVLTYQNELYFVQFLRFDRLRGNAWENALPFVPSGNGTDFHTAIVHRGELVLSGHWPASFFSSTSARWNGSEWKPMGLAFSTPPDMFCEHDGDLIAGGTFSSASGSTWFNRCARWNGFAWGSIGPSETSTPVLPPSQLASFNGQLYGLISGVQRFDGFSWAKVGPSLTYAMTVYNNTLVVAGTFTTYESNPYGRIAAFDGVKWTNPFGAGLGSGSIDARAFATFQGSLYVGGRFSTAGGVADANFAAWNPNPQPPVITRQPVSGTACRATPTHLWLEHTDVFASYQWFHDGQPVVDIPGRVSGANLPVLTFTTPHPDDAGTYTCVLTNLCGNATSEPVEYSVCLADLNCDGFSDALDYDLFLASWVAGEPVADLDSDTFVDAIDLDIFIRNWSAGC